MVSPSREKQNDLEGALKLSKKPHNRSGTLSSRQRADRAPLEQFGRSTRTLANMTKRCPI